MFLALISMSNGKFNNYAIIMIIKVLSSLNQSFDARIKAAAASSDRIERHGGRQDLNWSWFTSTSSDRGMWRKMARSCQPDLSWSWFKPSAWFSWWAVSISGVHQEIGKQTVTITWWQLRPAGWQMPYGHFLQRNSKAFCMWTCTGNNYKVWSNDCKIKNLLYVC